MSGKKGLDRYTEIIWRPIIEKELSHIKDSIVADFGCGYARYTSQLADNNEYLGVDIIDTPFSNIHSSVEDVPISSEYCDDVVALGILDYAEPYSTLCEAMRVLKPGGSVYIMVPHAFSPYHLVSMMFGSRKDKRRYTYDEISAMIHRLGFVEDYAIIKGFCVYVPTKMLQDLLIPVFLALDGVLGQYFGNNVYLRAHKPKR